MDTNGHFSVAQPSQNSKVKLLLNQESVGQRRPEALWTHTMKKLPLFIVMLTNSSSMLVWHFSRFILFMATRSCLGVQRAACTTAVAPLPGITDK